MRIAIDARIVRPKLQGVGRHVLNLLLGLSARESDLEFLVFYNHPVSRKLVERSGGPFRGRFQWIKTIAQPGSLIEKVEIPWLLKIHNADLFHDVSNTGVRMAGNLPVVVTVHELAALHSELSGSTGSVRRIRRSLRNARLVISVSQSLSDEIEAKLGISRPKLRVISNAIDPWYSERVTEKETRAMRERFKLPGRYFLCVTADRPQKNLALVLNLAQKLGARPPQAAGGSFSRAPAEWVFTLPGVDAPPLRYLDAVEDVWLRPLYAAATVLVAPSIYEGFSLPPLEALAAGATPVVSDIAPHRETLSDILLPELFFDPTSTESLEKALSVAVDGGEPLRASILEKFRLVRDRYSFIETARLVEAVYREALRG